MKGIDLPYISHTKKIKNFLPKQNFSLFFLAFFVTLFLITPLETNAIFGDIVDGIKTAATFLAGTIIALVLWVIQWIALAAAFLSVVLFEAFINFVFTANYTPLAETREGIQNGPLTTAWSLVRDIANMSFIIILMVIGIGTMTGIKIAGREINEKLLFPFITMALLINFSPLITGALIDVSHIMSKVFFDPVLDALGQFTGTPWSQNHGFPSDVTNLDIVAPALVRVIISITFNFLIFFSFIAASFLLVMRMIALQLLVILSPAAFALNILPNTKSIFQTWWKQFFQWLILPIPLSFFAFLSITFMSADEGNICPNETTITRPQGSDINQGLESLISFLEPTFCGSIVLILSLVTLIAGIVISMNNAPKGSSFIINKAKDAARWTRGAAVGATLGATKLSTIGAARGAAWGTRQGLGGLLRRRSKDKEGLLYKWGENVQDGKVTQELKKFGLKNEKVKSVISRLPGNQATKAENWMAGKAQEIEEGEENEFDLMISNIQDSNSLFQKITDTNTDPRLKKAIARKIAKDQSLDFTPEQVEALTQTVLDENTPDDVRKATMKAMLSNNNIINGLDPTQIQSLARHEKTSTEDKNRLLRLAASPANATRVNSILNAKDENGNLTQEAKEFREFIKDSYTSATTDEPTRRRLLNLITPEMASEIGLNLPEDQADREEAVKTARAAAEAARIELEEATKEEEAAYKDWQENGGATIGPYFDAYEAASFRKNNAETNAQDKLEALVQVEERVAEGISINPEMLKPENRHIFMPLLSKSLRGPNRESAARYYLKASKKDSATAAALRTIFEEDPNIKRQLDQAGHEALTIESVYGKEATDQWIGAANTRQIEQAIDKGFVFDDSNIQSLILNRKIFRGRSKFDLSRLITKGALTQPALDYLRQHGSAENLATHLVDTYIGPETVGRRAIIHNGDTAKAQEEYNNGQRGNDINEIKKSLESLESVWSADPIDPNDTLKRMVLELNALDQRLRSYINQ